MCALESPRDISTGGITEKSADWSTKKTVIMIVIMIVMSYAKYWKDSNSYNNNDYDELTWEMPSTKKTGIVIMIVIMISLVFSL